MKLPGRAIRVFFLSASLALAIATPLLYAIEVPRLQGRVSDYAGMISPQAKAAIEEKLAALERAESTQIAVLTVPALEGMAIEDFSIKVAEQWKIGQKKLDNGVIFIVSKNDRKMRIEVGYGLEGKLTDLLAGRILDYEVRPAFRAGNYDQGFLKGIDGIIAAVRGEYKASDAPARSTTGGSAAKPMTAKEWFITIAIIFMIVSTMIIGYRSILWGSISGPAQMLLFFGWFGPFSLSYLFALVFVGLVIAFVLAILVRAFSWTGDGGGSGGVYSSSSGWSGGSSYDSGSSWSGGGGSFGGGGASSDW